MDWLFPETADELTELLRRRAAGDDPVLVTGAPEPPAASPSPSPAAAAVVSTARMSGVLEHRPRDLTVTVAAGTRVGDLLEYLADRSAWIPLSGPAGELSVGGAVASALPGPYDAGHGDLRRQLLACELVTWTGRRTRWGRGVMKDVAGYGMTRAVAGSFGRLGVIHRATFRLWPASRHRRRVLLLCPEGEVPLDAAERIARSDFDARVRPDAAVWRRAAGEERLEVRLAGSPDSVDARLDRLRSWATGAGLEVGGVSRPPPAADRAEALSAGPFGRGRRSGVSAGWIAAGRGGFAAAAREARAALGEDLVSLQGYPLSGHLRCAWRRPDPEAQPGEPSGKPTRSGGGAALPASRGEPSERPFRRLLAGLDGAPIRLERGTRSELAAARAHRSEAVTRLERRALEALGGRRRQWLSGYL